MSRMLPYPLLAASLLAMWVLLNGLSAGHVVLGTAIAVAASHVMLALEPAKPRIRRWYLLPKLVAIVLADIWRSNIAVARLILRRDQSKRPSGFIVVPLELRNRTGLVILAVILTSTPGTAWVEYDSTRSTVLLHIFDLVDETYWIDLIKNRYEHLLLEILE
ncbi:Na+/H+ antiporter subunit E [Bradyrhizobium sp. LHD-71]|uniref:Na+/H+ antiporter subunit E n=1 Tax=Bradyrhizobium sp. LHD-71 TaxID=3072141 RepID=UPI00280F0E37|nr:Na+/H+ antiporter subunit E [Bradyrhizobium sp. LHD-71]MDQ8727689.1 Na+/H+ antiporter subunit E [Bradyrhizobium sp. LHD-71]